ncbi:MAG: SDR family oxidoreductase [Crocinitomicaceae bacterium]|nr:SDR family oxidoreductase [Crocinitomicaceae bacterium]
MKILLTGANGYVGKRLLPVLLEDKHEVICCVRDIKRFHFTGKIKQKVKLIEVDLLDKESLNKIPNDIDGAFYLVHSMSESKDYENLEIKSAINFRNAINKTAAKHVIYLSGIINKKNLSQHLSSRKNVENELSKGNYNTTTLRAGIIIGSGSASFEIIRDLVEKLPFMITPIWLKTKCQPIGIHDVILFLSKTIFNAKTFNKNFDIGGPDILSYKEMLLGFSAVRNLKRKIVVVPVMTPKLSSYWLYFVTSTSYKLAIALVDSMKIEVVCRNKDLQKILNITPLSYNENLKRAFNKIHNKDIASSWKDAYSSSGSKIRISKLIEVPSYGCFTDKRSRKYANKKNCINMVWNIGGSTGWYYGNWLWRIRGFLDKIIGGVGLRRGRTNTDSINAGDALDFWRVLYANKKNGHLLLFAEMKLPGEAWLEFKISEDKLVQTATFRPLGLWGRIYWFLVFPFHGFIFRGMLKRITS